jgi:hypothetical protein
LILVVEPVGEDVDRWRESEITDVAVDELLAYGSRTFSGSAS